MKRAASIILAVAVAGAAALPFWLGVRAERGYREVLATWSREGQWAIEELSYRRGWLESDAATRISLVPANRAGPQGPDISRWTRFVVKSRVSHGPWPLAGEFAGRPSPGVALAVVDSDVFLAEEPEGPPLLRIRTRVGWDGAAQCQVRSPAAAFAVGAEGGRVEWSGAEGEVAFEGLEHAKGSLAGPGLTFWAGEGSGEVSDLSLTFDLRQGEAGLVVGDYGWSVGRMAVTGGQEGVPITVENLRMATSAVPAGPYLHGTTSVAVGSVQAGTDTYGPADLRLVVRNLDASAIAQWQKTVQSLQGRAASAEEFTGLMGESFREVLPQILAASPELELESLRVTTTEGEISARGAVSFDGSLSVDLDAPQSLIAGVGARLVLGAPAALVHNIARTRVRKGRADSQDAPGGGTGQEGATARAARQQVEGLVAQGLLRAEGAGYALDLQFERGALTVNGNPWPKGR